MTQNTIPKLATAGPEPPPVLLAEPPALVTLDQIDMSPAPELLLDILDPIGHTILYGTGGVGKGVIAADLAGRLVASGKRVALLDFENNAQEWARRIGGLHGETLKPDVLYLAPGAPDWRGRGGPLPECVDEIAERLARFEADYLIVDSLGFAVGSDPSSAEVANAYNRAIVRIGLPTLSLGHVAREANMAYPFGSVFWHNGARMTWGAVGTKNGIELSNHKHNNYPWSPPRLVTVTWDTDIDPLRGLRGVPRKVEMTYLSQATEDRIARLLAQGPLTTAQIQARLDEEADPEHGDGEGIKPATVRKALSRGMDERTKRFEKVGDRYQLVDWTEPTTPTPQPEQLGLYDDQETQ